MRVGPPRKLSDFRQRTPAEVKLLAEYASGEVVTIGTKRPDADADPDVQIRADLIRYLLLDGCDELDHPVHEKGVQIKGARITGTLDLQGCRSPRNLLLAACHFDQAPNLLSAALALVVFNRSELPGIEADRLTTSEGLFLDGAKVTTVIELRGANIGGDLDLDDAELTGNAEATGAEATALWADGSTVKGTVFLSQTQAKGGIRLVGADIDGVLDCAGAKLTACENGKLGHGNALDLAGAKIKGSFFLRGEAIINGTLDMSVAEIGNLNDDPACWPKPGNLILDRCRYGAFLGMGVTARERLRWLGLQDPTLFEGQEFWPQPWEECAKVLREMGHRSDARAILIDKEKRQRAWARGKHPFFLRPFAWAKDKLLATTIGYGHRPLMAFRWIALFWLIGIAVFWAAHDAHAFKPNNSFVLRAPEWVLCGVQSDDRVYLPSVARLQNGRAEPDEAQLACFERQREAQSYPKFNPVTYAADTLFPLVDIEMQAHWLPNENAGPIGQAARYYLWIHIAFGWALSLLAVAGFSGLVRND